ncbi:hypothetical protein ONZ45_g574 [Pleurotus djamor]|nr:hypothetical protein ONZ45_g574 [Pleurotus djamor]
MAELSNNKSERDSRSSGDSSNKTKRKRPPTFQHFPEKRAKVLKKAWIDNAKVKRKWAAERRKAGLPLSRRSETAPDRRRAAEEEQGEHRSGGEEEEENEQGSVEESVDTAEVIAVPAESTHGKARRRPPAPIPAATTATRTTATPTDVKHRSSRQTKRSQQWRRVSESEAYTRRGQPNMKVRMEAMLEKIKKDFA